MGEPGGRLRFEHVSKRFPAPPGGVAPVDALREVSFEIGPDEGVGLVGPNGAGKSTILRLAAGVSGPSSGTVARSGQTVAIIELGAGIHPDLTGRENIELLSTLATGRARLSKQQFHEIVEFAGLEHVAERPARQYSTGMVARLAFSVSVHADPELLLLDEVLSVGDLAFQDRCRDRILHLRDTGCSVVLVSHDMGLIASICDRTLLVDSGRIELDGPTDMVVRRYLGLPERADDSGGFEVRVNRGVVRSGDPIRLELDLPPGTEGALRVDLVVPAHPTFLSFGQDFSTVFGRAREPAMGAGVTQLELTTAGVPPGRFEIVCAIEDRNGVALGTRTVPVTITGEPGPFAIRLESSARLDDLPSGAGARAPAVGER